MHARCLHVRPHRMTHTHTHIHTPQGKILLLQCDGVGRRMFVGTSVVHLGNLSGEAVRSVDYSMYG